MPKCLTFCLTGPNPSELKSRWFNTRLWWHRLKERNEVYLEVEPQQRLQTHHCAGSTIQSNLTKRLVTHLSLASYLQITCLTIWISGAWRSRRRSSWKHHHLRCSAAPCWSTAKLQLNTVILNEGGIKTSLSWQLKQHLKITSGIVIIIHDYVISGAYRGNFYLTLWSFVREASFRHKMLQHYIAQVASHDSVQLCYYYYFFLNGVNWPGEWRC